MNEEMVKMSAKGQLVVPQEIREKEGLKEGDRFVPFALKEGVLFKKIKMHEIKIEFEKLSKEIGDRFKRNKVSKDNIEEAVKWTRKEQ